LHKKSWTEIFGTFDVILLQIVSLLRTANGVSQFE